MDSFSPEVPEPISTMLEFVLSFLQRSGETFNRQPSPNASSFDNQRL